MKAKKPGLKPGLVKRAVAEAGPSGKLRLSRGGRAWLAALKARKASEIPKVVRATKPTSRRKNVLFVCTLGSGASHDGQWLFAETAKEKPLNASLFLGHIGFVSTVFLRKVAESDFIVSMGPAATVAIERAVKGISKKDSKKPCIIDMGFRNVSDTIDKSYYVAIREKIRKELEKEKK